MTLDVHAIFVKFEQLLASRDWASHEIESLAIALRDPEASDRLAGLLDALIAGSAKNQAGVSGVKHDPPEADQSAVALEGALVSAVRKSGVRRADFLRMIQEIIPDFGIDFDARKASTVAIARRFLAVSTLEQGRDIFTKLGFPILSDPYLDGISQDD